MADQQSSRNYSLPETQWRMIEDIVNELAKIADATISLHQNRNEPAHKPVMAWDSAALTLGVLREAHALRSWWKEEMPDSAQGEQIHVLDALVQERDRLLEAVPRCKEHGLCVPHAIEWVENAKAKLSETRPSRIERVMRARLSDMARIAADKYTEREMAETLEFISGISTPSGPWEPRPETPNDAPQRAPSEGEEQHPRGNAEDAARFRFLERMWPIGLLKLLNSHLDDMGDKTVVEAIDAAMSPVRKAKSSHGKRGE